MIAQFAVFGQVWGSSFLLLFCIVISFLPGKLGRGEGENFFKEIKSAKLSLFGSAAGGALGCIGVCGGGRQGGSSALCGALQFNRRCAL